MKKQWKIKEQAASLPELPEYPNLILKLLALRGITTDEAIRDFLDPDFGKLHDPFLFKQMQPAVERIRSAIDTKQKNPHDEYPFPYLTGVGVAFKLVQALFTSAPTLRSGQPAVAGWEKWLLDLVALGTVADLQSLTGENRILVSFGLKVLAKTRW